MTFSFRCRDYKTHLAACQASGAQPGAGSSWVTSAQTQKPRRPRHAALPVTEGCRRARRPLSGALDVSAPWPEFSDTEQSHLVMATTLTCGGPRLPWPPPQPKMPVRDGTLDSPSLKPFVSTVPQLLNSFRILVNSRVSFFPTNSSACVKARMP